MNNDILRLLIQNAKDVNAEGTIKLTPALIDRLYAELTQKPAAATPTTAVAAPGALKLSELLKLIRLVALRVDQGAASVEFKIGA